MGAVCVEPPVVECQNMSWGSRIAIREVGIHSQSHCEQTQVEKEEEVP